MTPAPGRQPGVRPMSGAGPTVSAIICAHNHGPFVARAIQSALDQSVAPLEVIVVDDGSTDDTRLIIATLFGDRVRYHYQENRGPSAARNLAIGMARGDWVAFLDADDLWLPGKLERQVAALRGRPQSGLVACAGFSIRPDGTGRKPIPIEDCRNKQQMLEKLRRRCLFVTTGTMVKRTLFQVTGGFPEDLRLGEDHIMWARLAAVSDVLSVDEPLFEKTDLQTGLMSNPRLIEDEGVVARRLVLEALAGTGRRRSQLNLAIERRYLEARAYVSAAEQWALRGDLPAAARTLCRLLRLWPIWPMGAYRMWAWLAMRSLTARRMMRA